MEATERLGMLLQRRAELRKELHDVEAEARSLLAKVSADLGMPVQHTLPIRPRTSQPGKSERVRVLEAFNEVDADLRAGDLLDRFAAEGKPVKKSNLRSYLGELARDGKIVRVEGDRGLYRSLKRSRSLQAASNATPDADLGDEEN